MKKAFVTGADEFIGSHLTELLLKTGYRVRALSNYNFFNYWGWLEDIHDDSNLEIIPVNIGDPHLCKEIVQNVDIIFNPPLQSR